MNDDKDSDEDLFRNWKRSHERDEFIEMFERALNKWLDEQFALFGKWTLRGVLAMTLGWLVYIYIHTGGFSK